MIEHLGTVGLAEIGGEALCGAAECVDLFGRLIGGPAIAVARDRGACFGKRKGNGGSDAARGACNGGDFVIEAETIENAHGD